MAEAYIVCMDNTGVRHAIMLGTDLGDINKFPIRYVMEEALDRGGRVVVVGEGRKGVIGDLNDILREYGHSMRCNLYVFDRAADALEHIRAEIPNSLFFDIRIPYDVQLVREALSGRPYEPEMWTAYLEQPEKMPEDI